MTIAAAVAAAGSGTVTVAITVIVATDMDAAIIATEVFPSRIVGRLHASKA